MQTSGLEKGAAVVRLNKKFYDGGSIRACLKEFSMSSSMKLREEDGAFCVLISSRGRLSPQEVGKEFCNYLLAYMKNNNSV